MTIELVKLAKSQRKLPVREVTRFDKSYCFGELQVTESPNQMTKNKERNDELYFQLGKIVQHISWPQLALAQRCFIISLFHAMFTRDQFPEGVVLFT